MQDGKYTNQFEVVSVTASSTEKANHICSSALKTFLPDANASGNYQASANHSSSFSMSNGLEPWSPGSISLSTVTNSGGPTSNGSPHSGHYDGTFHARTDKPDGCFEATEQMKASSTLSTQKSNSSCSSLREHDYIGLSSDSSSSSEQGATASKVSPGEICAGKFFDLDSKETELRLGLGPSLVPQGTRGFVHGGSLRAEAKQECHGVSEGHLSKNMAESKNLFSEKLAEITETGNNCMNDVLDQGFSSFNSESASTAEKINHPSAHKFPRPFNQEPRPGWSGEQHGEAGGSASGRVLLSQHGLISSNCSYERRFYAVQERFANEKLGHEVNYPSKEQPWQCPVVSGQYVPFPGENQIKESAGGKQHAEIPGHGAQGAQDYRASVPKVLSGGLDLRLPPRDPSVSADGTAYDALAGQKFWPQITRSLDGFRGATTQDVSQASVLELENGKSGYCAAPSGFPGARLLIPVAKNTVPAKRGYMEAIGPSADSRAGFAMDSRPGAADQRPNSVSTGPPLCHGGVNSSNLGGAAMEETKLANSQVLRHHTAPVLYPWGNSVQLPAGWQQVSVEQTKSVFGSVAPRGAMPSQPKGVGNDPVNEPPLAKDTHMKPPPSSSRQGNHENPHGTNVADDGGASSARAPVVGWPPIRSFRKNTLQAANTKSSAEEQELAGASSDAAETGNYALNTLYVKANMDGVPIGRKVDLNAYDNYESLKTALEDMFQRFINGHNGGQNPSGRDTTASKPESKQLNLLRGSEYVLTHEDKDGDWMLVGDVPWEMFVSTVRRLRIMKSSEAIGLGQRVSSKLKTQANN